MLKAGSAWMPDNEINGVDFVLPFRLSRGTVAGHARAGNVTDRRGEKPGHSPKYHRGSPWRLSPTEANPLLLTNVKVEALGGKITMQQLRMPQHDPALLRVDNISSSELISAVNPKQFAMSGPVSGALPFWLDNEKWIIKDGWLTNPGPMTLRIDQTRRMPL